MEMSTCPKRHLVVEIEDVIFIFFYSEILIGI